MKAPVDNSWLNSRLKLSSRRVNFKTSLQCVFCFNELFYTCCQSVSRLSLRLSPHPPLRFQYLKHFKEPRERDRSRIVTLTCHQQVMSEIIGSCFGAFTTRGDPLLGGENDIKGLRGRKWQRTRQIEGARRESASGHCMFESSSWDPDDRVVLWDFKSKGSEVGVPPPRRGMGQEGRLWLSKRPQLYLYYIFSSPGLFQREQRTVFRFRIRCGPCLLFPRSVFDNAFVSGATFTHGLHVRYQRITER